MDPLCQNFLDPRMICPDETCEMYKMTIQNTLIPSLWLAVWALYWGFLGLLHKREREREREREWERERERVYIDLSYVYICLSVCLSVGPSVCQSVFDKAVTN